MFSGKPLPRSSSYRRIGRMHSWYGHPDAGVWDPEQVITRSCVRESGQESGEDAMGSSAPTYWSTR